MNTKMRNKIAGAIYGFAIGDAMGATTEFMDAKQIKEKYGKVTDIIGGGWLGLNPGEITDDTQMTMCVMDAIMRAPKDEVEFVEYCEGNFIEWINSRPKDVGAQCARAINDLMFGAKAKVDDNALGNGSLMRAMPLAVLNLPFYNLLQGKITHNNRRCSKTILEYSYLIQEYLRGTMEYKYAGEKKGPHGFTSALMVPSGCVTNTYNNAVVWSTMHSFEDAIIGAVNHGGDADTIAAITGSLAGARFGYDAIPERWVNQLNPDVKFFLEKFKNFAFSCLQI